MEKAYYYLACQFHTDKTQHLNCTDLIQIINDSKEKYGDTLRHNYAMREEERVHMYLMKEQERVHMAQNTIIISS